MSSLHTERLAVVARPRFAVDGQDQPRISADLIRMEVDQDDLGLARLEFVLSNLDAAEDGEAPELTWSQSDELALGKRIEVRAGDEDNDAVIFEGTVTCVEARFSSALPPELLVRAEDDLMWLRMGQRTRIHKNRTDARIAQDVGRDHGLNADADVDGPEHVELWQINRSDLAFLRERARAVDARLELRDGRLRFKPHGEDADPPLSLSPTAELVDLQVCADLAHQRSKVRVHGWSVDQGQPMHEEADCSAAVGEDNGGSRGDVVLRDAGLEAIEDLHLEAPKTPDEARALALAAISRRARRFVVARGRTDGSPGLRVGRRVELVDVGTRFEGTYETCHVRHLFDQHEGLRTFFEAERVDLGGA